LPPFERRISPRRAQQVYEVPQTWFDRNSGEFNPLQHRHPLGRKLTTLFERHLLIWTTACF